MRVLSEFRMQGSFRSRTCRCCYNSYQKEYGRSNPAKRMLQGAKARAARDGLPFLITEEDIVIPELCPVFGTPLGESQWVDSPSLDRTVPHLGYVPGNIVVMSARANILKRDATASELVALASYITKQVIPWNPPSNTAEG